MTAQLPSRERLEALASGNAFTCVQDDEAAAMARALLPAQEQEPVAWQWQNHGQWHVTNDEERARDLAWDGVEVLPLYTHPAPVPAVPDAVTKLLNILDRHTVELGWCEPPISLAELVIARDGREELDTIRAMLNGGKS